MHRRHRWPTVALAAATFSLIAPACGEDEAEAPPPVLTGTSIAEADAGVPVLGVEVVQAVGHRTDAWTEGLVWDDGILYESAGLTERSSLAELDPTTGQATRTVPLDAELYAEGLALVDDELVQITWQNGVALRYDAATFDEVGRYSYDGEGWGLCFDGERLVMSNGSSSLTFRDAETFDETGTVDVTLDGEPVDELNELECVGDRVYANVWHTDTIVEIDAESGEVSAVIDAGALRSELDPPITSTEDVLNGIAHDPEAGTFWLTGKFWPQLFEVRFVDADDGS